jgi:D-hexose-6-phosphate mutarotase
MKLTIGMASYNNKYEVWSTVQALRIYHDMQDTEIVIIDNFGDSSLENWASGQSNVNYFKEIEVVGTAYPRDMIFKRAKGEWVLVIDSCAFIPRSSKKDSRLV